MNLRCAGFVLVVLPSLAAGRAWAQDPAAPSPPAEPPLPPPLPAPPDPLPPPAPDLPLAPPPPPAEKPAAKPGIPPELKLSGYIQGRYEWHDDANFGLDAKGNPRETSRFLVRRAHLKATYTQRNAEFVLQLSGSTTEAFNITDAEASFLDTWTPLQLKLTVGQFKVPFGFEVLQWSSEREAPERSLFVRSFFPGERDRGVRLSGAADFLHFIVALVNGNGTRDAVYNGYDQTSWKDLVGRLQAKLGLFNVGASAYWGRSLPTNKEMRTYERYERFRVGGDTQLVLSVPSLGDLHLRGELIWATDSNMGFAGVLADPCKDFHSLGWYATVIQRLPADLGVAFRVDQFNPLAGVGEACARRAESQQDRRTTYGGGVFSDTFAGLRATLWYEHVTEQGATVDNDVLYAQLHAKF